jgi:hypothetical protein
MDLIGQFSEFSLPEIFQFIEQGNKTGLLTVDRFPKVDNQPSYYIWFRQGYIVAAANRSDKQGLLSLMQQKGIAVDNNTLSLLKDDGLKNPLGLWFKSQGLLAAEQLKTLFNTQVMGAIEGLLKLKNAIFKFDSSATLSMAEMTGLSIAAKEINLKILRNLQDWSSLTDKLPEPTSGFISEITGKPSLPLNQLEAKVWEFANGSVSISTIAKRLNVSVEAVQKIAFCFTVVGLAAEMPLAESDSFNAEIDSPIKEQPDAQSPTSKPLAFTTNIKTTTNNAVSQSFMQNLFSFLRNKS